MLFFPLLQVQMSFFSIGQFVTLFILMVHRELSDPSMEFVAWPFQDDIPDSRLAPNWHV